MRRDDSELDGGSFQTAGYAVGGLGLFGLLVGVSLGIGGWGDPQIIEAHGMISTATILCVAGICMVWWGGEL